MRRTEILLGLAILAHAGCTAVGPAEAPTLAVGALMPSEAELIEGLPSYQSPGPNVLDGLHDQAGRPAPLPADVRFASTVVRYEPGAPAPSSDAADATAALGAPDYVQDVHAPPHAVSLGNGGTLTLHFDGAGLGDSPGADLFVFEIGAPEALEISVSDDGRTWRELGRVPGGAVALDVAPVVGEGEAFHWVRLVDVAGQGPESPAFAGADVDAVGVRAGEVRRIVVAAPVLFAFDDAALGPGAGEALDEVLRELALRPGASITVDGHTDDVGSREYNRVLSLHRANAVSAYLAAHGLARGRLVAHGYGAERPAVSGTDEGSRQRNRRVEIVLHGR